VTSEERLATWIEWLEGDLFQAMTSLVYQVHTYRSFNAMMDFASEESKSNGWFHRWVRVNYRDSVLSAIRRQSLRSSDDRSIIRLLMELEANADVVSLEWKSSGASSEIELEVLLSDWESLSVASGEYLDSRVVQDEIDGLEAALESVSAWATHHIAHQLTPDRRTEIQSINYTAVHEAVDALWNAYSRWYLILVSKSVVYPDPVPWEHVLATRWIDAEVAEELLDQRRSEVRDRRRNQIAGT